MGRVVTRNSAPSLSATSSNHERNANVILRQSTARHEPMKTHAHCRRHNGRIQSAFAMLGAACLVGEARELFARIEDTQPISEPTLHTPVLPSLPPQIRKLIHAACLARGGAERMTLSDWREVEREVNRRTGS